jgi:transposase
LEVENATLKARNTELERRLGLDSSNSGKPPSSDGLKKQPRVRSSREPSGKKPGGQKGHKGETLRQVAEPDSIVDHFPPSCTACGVAVTPAMSAGHSARQVFDLPEPRPLVVTEHRAHDCMCAGCGARTRASFPDGVNAPVQYGPRIAAFVIYLLHYQLLPEDRLAELMADLFGIRLVAATIARMSRTCAARACRISSPRCAAWWPALRSSTWTRLASGSAARPSGCMWPAPAGSPSIASAPSAAACWPMWPASWSSGVRVWVATGHTDMRRGMNSLPLQVQEALKRDPHGGDLYVFRDDNAVAKAMDYMLKRVDAFTRFLEDGRICVSNNAAERELRGIALGRKAWLFAGSDEGASCCSSHHLLINPVDFVAYRQAAGVVIGAH